MKELEKVKCRICEELGVLKEFKFQSLGIHLNAAHPNVTLEVYYLRYINPDAEGKCKFCGDKAIFLGLTKGYRNNCKSNECYKKVTNPSSKEYKMKIAGLSEEAYIEWKKKDAERKKEITITGFIIT
jgi:hypothetical protein